VPIIFATVRKYVEEVVAGVAATLVVCIRSRPYRVSVQFITDLVRVLWVCRIAFASVSIATLIMWIAPQARDLFLEISGFRDSSRLQHLFANSRLLDLLKNNHQLDSLLFALVFVIAIIGLWAIPLHEAARWSLNGLSKPPQTLLGRKTAHLLKSRPALNPRIVLWIPRLLGLTCFVAVGIGIRRAASGQFDDQLVEIAQFARRQLYIFAAATILGALVFFAYTLIRFRIFNLLIGGPIRRKVSVGYRNGSRVIRGRGVGLLQIIGAICVLVVTGILIWYIWRPQNLHLEWRILLVPVVLGTWVPALSFLTWLSYPARMPIVTIIVFLIACYQVGNEGHSIRTIAADRDLSAAQEPIEIDRAIELWRAANFCSDKCPRPIIVVAAGGASRAAYMTASVLGLFMDFSCDPAGQPSLENGNGKKRVVPCETAGTPLFANRLFAISGVSGGSLGAAVFSAVLRAHQNAGSPPRAPCRVERPARFWFRGPPPKGWRDCMQIILSEDFLTPAILGLAFRDMLPFLGLSDRAALLEDAWINAVNKFVLEKSESNGRSSEQGLAGDFTSYAPENKIWRPLLILNGTSVATGRRILTSHLAFHSRNKLLFSDAYDFREMLAEATTNSTPRSVSLATAVTNSARFPIISPPGVILKDDRSTLDRIVDGGYFENYGITTAQEVAKALKERGENPLVLLITNEPLSTADAKRLSDASISPPMPKKQDSQWFSWLSSPLLALYQTRSSRGDLATIRTVELPELGGDVIHLTVYGEPAAATSQPMHPNCTKYTLNPVSMSWWLSKPVQEYLDNQFFNPTFSCGKQQVELHRLCENLFGELATRCHLNLDAFL
jgi:hypothetical protein